VQVGTATFVDPRAPQRIAGELDRFLRKSGIPHARDLKKVKNPSACKIEQ
jgi:hypothetical protein